MPLIDEAPRLPAGYYEARPGDVVRVLDSVILVDVRGESELVGPSGHIHGVRHIPMAEVLAHGLGGVDKATPVVLVCEVGPRAQTCAKHLVGQGHVEVYVLTGGMRRWLAEERPVSRRRA